MSEWREGMESDTTKGEGLLGSAPPGLGGGDESSATGFSMQIRARLGSAAVLASPRSSALI